jgi:type II secretory pathway component PulC
MRGSRSPWRAAAAIGGLVALAPVQPAALAASPGPAGPAASDAAATALPRLAAILVTGEDAAALFEFAEAQAWRRVGEKAGDCRVTAIRVDRAVLDCDGNRRTLPLAAGSMVSATTRDAALFAAVELPPGLLQSLAARPQALALAVDFAPIPADRGIAGWQVMRLDEHGPLAGLGLMEADLVVAVDGAPAAEPAAFASAVRGLRDSASFTLDLVRDGRPLTLLVATPPAAR